MAIKVVEAGLDNTDDAYQESVLSASIAHPNVVSFPDQRACLSHQSSHSISLSS